MERLFITADIHGSLSTWMTVKALLSTGDGLVIAGDLFDTRYGNYGDNDFQPESIKEEIIELCQGNANPLYYVYGNCDTENFLPGYGSDLAFSAFGKSIFLHHGHRTAPENCRSDIIIQGHTHESALTRKGNQLFINPGSISRPRQKGSTYALMDKCKACIIDLPTGRTLAAMDI